MNYMPRLAEDDPQQPCGECRAAVAQLMAMLEETCRVQRQHRVRLMLLERSMRNMRRRVDYESQSACSGQPD